MKTLSLSLLGQPRLAEASSGWTILEPVKVARNLELAQTSSRVARVATTLWRRPRAPPTSNHYIITPATHTFLKTKLDKARQRKSRHLAAPDRAQKRGQATASTGAAVTYVQGLIQTIQTPPIPPIQCMHGGSYISGASCARTTWLGLISTLKIRLEPLVVVPRCEGEWCGC